jgi:hypothetical protein
VFQNIWAALPHRTGNAAITSAVAINTNAHEMVDKIRAWIECKIMFKNFL